METEKPSDEKLLVSEPSKACTACGQSMLLSANFCYKCGQKAEAAHNNCAQCGRENKPDAQFCDSCGKNVAAVPQNPVDAVGYGIPVSVDPERQD